MLITDIIIKKRNKQELSKEEIEFFISSVTDQSIPDYQISALLMAIVINGMSEQETLNLTLAMAKSGDILDLSILGNKTVDKHSTGGVGDKTTLVVAPIVAALGCSVAKMSGRGLGHTGGTVDKLESINGYKTSVSSKEFIDTAKQINICLVGQSGNFAPADKKLYALRDVTGTVESIPLIASSIMSKKLAAGAKNIVLDVKYGSGAFMKNKKDAIDLATLMVKIGKGAGRNVTAIITNMNSPLGNSIGNNLEVIEAIELLKGKGNPQLLELCRHLAANMYKLCTNTSYKECLSKVDEVLINGLAFEKFCDLISSMGGNINLLTGDDKFQKSKYQKDIFASDTGYVSQTDCYLVGKAACMCGAGRETLEDTLDMSAGIILHKKVGDFVEKGDKIATLYGQQDKVLKAEKILVSAYKYSNKKPKAEKLIYKIIER